MDKQLAARAILRLVAFAMVAAGWFADEDVAFLYQNADIAALTALGLAELWFYGKKLAERGK